MFAKLCSLAERKKLRCVNGYVCRLGTNLNKMKREINY